MEVLVGPTFTIEVSSPQDNLHVNSSSSAAANCIFLKDDDESLGQEHLISGRLGSGIQMNELDNSSDSSSSIGAPDDSEEEEADSGSSSKGALASIDSLEDSLPVKRGLSNHFAGKSKSFTNLSEVSTSEATMKDLVKPENPFNKRRRLLMANKWCSRRKSSFYCWSNPKSMPLLALAEEDEEEHQHQHQHQDHHRYQADEKEDDDEGDEDNQSSSSAEQDVNHRHRTKQIPMKLSDRRFKTSFKSHSCFSLTDLQEEEEQYP